jgi:hypothetical protein
MTDDRYAVLDLETRCNLALARRVLGLGPTMAPSEVVTRLLERRRGENHGGSDFLKLPFHEPLAAALLLVEPRDASPGASLIAAEWVTWIAGEQPLEAFVERFFRHLAKRTYVGFNSLAFDLPLMELLASRCRIPAPAHFTAPGGPATAADPRARRSPRHCDLQRELANGAPGTGSFDELCKFHGLPGKPGVSGEDVESLAAAGRLDEVHAYNVTDVLQTHLLFLHVLVRAGRLSRDAAAQSARSAIALTRSAVLPRLPDGGAARALLAANLEGCSEAPIAQPGSMPFEG